MKKRIQLNVNIQKESLDSLKSRAIKSGQSLGSFVNKILSEYLEKDDEIVNDLEMLKKRIDVLENKFEILNNRSSKGKLNPPTFNEELAKRYTELMIEGFNDAKNELRLSENDVIDLLRNTDIAKRVEEHEFSLFKEIITGNSSFTAKDLQYMVEKYGTLPCFTAIEEIKPSSKLKDFCEEMGIY